MPSTPWKGNTRPSRGLPSPYGPNRASAWRHAWRMEVVPPILLYNTGSRAQDSETKAVHTPRRRVAPPAAERDGREPRGIPKLNPVKALKPVQRHRFCPRKQTRWAISRRARISSCAGSSSKTYPSAWSMAESGPQRPTDAPGQSRGLVGGIAIGRVESCIVRHPPRPVTLRRHPLRPLRPERRQGPGLGQGPSAGAPIAYGPRTVRLNARGCRPSVGPAPPSPGGRRRPGQDDAVADGLHPYAGGRFGSRARLGAKIRRKVTATEMAEAPAEPSPPVIASAASPARPLRPLPERL